MSEWQRAVQYMDHPRDRDEAVSMLGECRRQVDFIAGRVLPPTDTKPGWRLQCLFQDCGHDLPLPDGMRRVIVPPSLLTTMKGNAACP
jgi:hypothetical protein